MATVNITFAAVTNRKLIQFSVKYFKRIGAFASAAMVTPEIMNLFRASIIELKVLKDKVVIVKPTMPETLKTLSKFQTFGEQWLMYTHQIYGKADCP